MSDKISLEEELIKVREINKSLADRVATQSEILTNLAERRIIKGTMKELVPIGSKWKHYQFASECTITVTGYIESGVSGHEDIIEYTIEPQISGSYRSYCKIEDWFRLTQLHSPDTEPIYCQRFIRIG